MSIWELRNPTLSSAYIKALAKFNFNKDAANQLQALHPLNPNQLFTDRCIDDWATKVKERLPSMRGKLL